MRLRCTTRTGVVRRRDSFSNSSRVSELKFDGWRYTHILSPHRMR